jgi:ammonia channel protein AmtB
VTIVTHRRFRLNASAARSGVATFIILNVIELVVPPRVSQQSEIEGLDVTQRGEALE